MTGKASVLLELPSQWEEAGGQLRVGTVPGTVSDGDAKTKSSPKGKA